MAGSVSSSAVSCRHGADGRQEDEQQLHQSTRDAVEQQQLRSAKEQTHAEYAQNIIEYLIKMVLF